MANYNSGNWIRFENGAKLINGSHTGTDELLCLVPGTVRLRTQQREHVQMMDRGVLGNVVMGDERPQEIEFQLYRTPVIDVLVAAWIPSQSSPTNGIEPFFSLTIKVPNYLGASTGYYYEFTKCYLPDGPEYQASGSGQDADKVTFRVVHAGGYVTPTSY